MAKKRRRQRLEDEPQVVNRRETRMRARDRKRNYRLTMVVGGAVGLALLLVVIGAVRELFIKPNTVLVQVAGETIITRDFWKRARLRQSELENQRFQLLAIAQQLGDSNLFTSQIASLDATLASPLSLGTQVLNTMIEDTVLRLKASELGVAVTDEEVEEALREEVARGQGALTEQQATAEAASEATTSSASFTPVPEDASNGEPTASAATETPTEPAPVLTDALYQEGLRTLEDNLRSRAGMILAEYREVIRINLIRTKMEAKIGQEQVSTTEEQVRVRHILISVDAEAEPSEGAEEPAEETTSAMAAADPSEAEMPDANSDGRVDDAEALAFMQVLRQRVLDGEDFGELAMQYSDDPGSGSLGGELGWAGRGRYVAEFDEAAFTLPIGEISEPVKTTFGYHLIEVVERDDERPKDENSLPQEYAQAFQTWLQEQVLALEIDRPANLSSWLPQDLGQPAGG